MWIKISRMAGVKKVVHIWYWTGTELALVVWVSVFESFIVSRIYHSEIFQGYFSLRSTITAQVFTIVLRVGYLVILIWVPCFPNQVLSDCRRQLGESPTRPSEGYYYSYPWCRFGGCLVQTYRWTLLKEECQNFGGLYPARSTSHVTLVL